ncbi:MAG TPA: aminopeptidase P family protein [Burkholderiaceae bacterium]|nr:aminopeptidase P family protein [Burkholderiaceae bacterium]HQR70282.1 aminopeptidase P family protein [Burkholderiaceae bacterium]
MDTLDSRRATVRARIEALRQAMARNGLAAVIVPSSDPHLSEYLPDRWKGREWASGFTGSVGTLVVTPGAAGVWVDSRYWTQAEVQLAGTGIDLMKVPGAASLAHVDWLADTLKAGDAVAVDGTVLGLSAGRALETALTAKGIRLRTDLDLLAEVWPDRAALPIPPIYEHIAPYASTPRTAKLALVREEMRKAGATHHLISTLDDIAWLTNLRGADVSYNPVFVAHLLIDARTARLFVADGKVENALEARLAADGIDVVPYTQAAAALAALPPAATLLIDPRRITLGMRQVVPAGVEVIEAINPTTLAKSRKTAAEVAHIRATMEQDGAALAEFFAWFEAALGKELVTELTIDEKITSARARRPGFVCPSFTTIAAFNANGAQPHYKATDESHATIGTVGSTGNGMLLIDSGGQYLGGTTDITRVVPVGETTAEQRRDYTLVLKGMIALSVARFPRGTRSPMLDTLARAPIWAAGIDFGHGTGHGVGYFLNVHEGPHGITPHLPPDPQTAMEPGMITSNEPGIYRPGHWGVRIENLVLNVPADPSEFGEFLRFETLTLCPIDTRLIDRALMRADEIGWLNAYHAEVQRRVGPLLSGAAAQWLQERTQAI